MAVLISPNLGLSTLAPGNGMTFTLQELQTAVGDYIEVHPMPPWDGHYMILTEASKSLGLPLNEEATSILFATRHGLNPPLFTLHGNAIVCTWEELQELKGPNRPAEEDDDVGEGLSDDLMPEAG